MYPLGKCPLAPSALDETVDPFVDADASHFRRVLHPNRRELVDV